MAVGLSNSVLLLDEADEEADAFDEYGVNSEIFELLSVLLSAFLEESFDL